MAASTAEYFTDPCSPWGWAVQPSVRRLRYEQPSLELVPRMTLLFPGTDRAESLADWTPPVPVDESFESVVRAAGMPFVDGHWDEPPSSVLASAAVAHVRETADARVEPFLHRVREAVFEAGEAVDSADRLVALAAEVGGIDGADLAAALDDGRATAALAADVERAHEVATELDGDVEIRGTVRRMPAARRRSALTAIVGAPDIEVGPAHDWAGSVDGAAKTAEDESPDAAAEPAETDVDWLVAPPAIRAEAEGRVIFADPRIGYERLATIWGRAIPHEVAELSEKFGTGRLARHVPLHVAEGLSSRDYLADVRAFVTRFERVFVPEVAAGTGFSPETCRESLASLAAAGVVEPLDAGGAGWRMIEGAAGRT